MKFLTVLKQLEELDLKVFTNLDLQKITGQNSQVVNNFLTYQIKNNNLIRLKRGFYTIKAQQVDLASTYKNSYIALYSALEYYQTTTQRYNTLFLISNKKSRKKGNVKLKIIMDKFFFGYIRIENAFISDIEKTLIDCILYNVSSEETHAFFRFFREKLDKEKLNSYLQRMSIKKLNTAIQKLYDN